MRTETATGPGDTPRADCPEIAPQQPGRRFPQIQPVWWALAGAILLTLLYAHVTVLHMADGIAGGKYNGYENLWNDWWLREALFRLHQNPFYTQYLDYPSGVSLRYHTLTPLGGLIALPLSPLIGPIATMNVKFLVAIAAAVVCAYLLIRDLTGAAFASFCGAVVYTFANTLMLSYYGSAEENYLMGTAMLPLYILFMLRATTRARWWRDGAAACALLFALCLTDWQYTLFAVLITVAYFAFVAVTDRTAFVLRVLGRLALIGGVWAVVVLPTLVLPMVREAQASPWLAVGDEAEGYSRQLWQFFALGVDNPGYAVFVLTVIGLIMLLRRGVPKEDRRTLAFWLLVAGGATLLSLGPRLQVGAASIPLPYLIITKLPVLNIGRKPHLFYASFAMLAYGVLFAFALRALLPAVRAWLARAFARRPHLAAGARFVGPVAVAALLAGSLAPFFAQVGATEVHGLDPPAFFRDVLAKDPAQYAILELPAFPSKRGQYGGTYQSFQLTHQKYRFGASISRDHSNLNPALFVKHAPFFRDGFWMEDVTTIETYRPTKTPDFLATPDYGKIAVPMLNYYNVRYIVLYRDALLDQRKLDSTNPTLVLDTAERLVHQALGPDARPVYQDDVAEVYRVPDAPSLAQPVFLDTGNDGWYAAEVAADKTPYRWADTMDGGPAELLVTNLSAERRQARVQFTLFNYHAARTVAVAINGYPAARFDLPPDGSREVTLDLDIPPGLNSLTLATAEPPLPVQADLKFGRDSRLLSFGLRNVRLG